MSSTIELVSYKEYPNDAYTKAVIVLCLDGKYNVAYGKKMGKDGQSWWKTASFSLDEGAGVKSYVESFCMDSNKANAAIQDFIRCEEITRKARSPAGKEAAPDQGLPF